MKKQTILFFIFCIALYNASAFLNDITTKYSYIDGSSTAGAFGLNFKLNRTYNMTFVNATFYNNNPTYCELYYRNDTAGAWQSQKRIAFANPMTVNYTLWAGGNYTFLCDKETTSWVRGVDSTFGTETLPDIITYQGGERIPYNSGTLTVSGKYPAQINTIYLENITVAGAGADITPPSISVSQTPTNWTLKTILSESNYITAGITDSTGVNNGSIKFEYVKNFSDVFVNGTLTQPNRNVSYTNATGTNYYAYVDEQDLLGGNFNIDHGLMETTPHSYFTLTGLNSWVKIEFLNVSNKMQYNFEEIMTINSTATPAVSEYYYCNSSYSAGNPISNNNCVLIFSELNNNGYNHTHGAGYSAHKVIPFSLNTTTGKIGNIYVTPTSYFLKRGTVSGDLIYYINTTSRTSAIQTSNNLGNAWSDFTGTIDAHLHSYNPSQPNQSSFNYRVCANDTASPSNYGCSSWYYDILDLPSQLPMAVTIYSPVYTYYNDSFILINHSQSTSSTSLISKYNYDYRIANATTWTNIYNNSHPTTTYTWDVSTFTNRWYQVKVTAFDALGFSTTTFSEEFYINNPLSTTDQLLTDILAEIQATREETSMIYTIGIIILPILIAFLLLYAANTLGEEHGLPKMFLFVLALMMPLISLQYSIEVTNNMSALEVLLSTLNTHAVIFSWIFYLIIIYLIIFLVVNLIKYLAEKKKEKLEY